MTDSDRRNTLLDSYENAAVMVSGIDADELSRPTPCPKYDVAGPIDHLVEAGHRAAALGRGQEPPPGVEPGAPFGAEVYPAPDADDWERLAAFMGRDPRTTLGL